LIFIFQIVEATGSSKLPVSWYNRIDQEIENLIKNYPVPGVVVLVGTKQDILFQKPYGYINVEQKRKTELETLYDIASITKLFTAVSVMILFDQKKLMLEDEVKIYFKRNFSDFDITLEDLLRHTTGMKPCLTSEEIMIFPEELWQNIYKIKPSFPIGKFKYSDINFLLLGKIVEQLAGVDLNAFENKYIFSKLGMNNTSYLPLKYLQNCTNFLAPTDKNLPSGIVHDPTARKLGGVAGHAGLFSTVGDLAKFCQMILNLGTFENNKILKKETVLQMVCQKEGYLRGLGFDILSRYSWKPRGKAFTPGKSFGHTGFTGTSLWIEPEKNIFLIILSNAVLAKNKKKAKEGLHLLWGRLADIVAQ